MEQAVKYIFLDAISYSTDPEEIAESMKAGLVIIIREMNRISLAPLPLTFSMRIFWKIPIKALQGFIFQLVLYQDHVLSQMVILKGTYFLPNYR